MPTPAAAPTPPSPPHRHRRLAVLRAARAGAATAAAAAAAGAAGAQRPLPRDRHLGRNRLEVEHLADERAQRDDELGDLDAAAGHDLVRRPRRQAHLLLGAEQDHVGERRLHRVAHAAAALGAGRLGGAPLPPVAASASTGASIGASALAAARARRSRKWRGSTARLPVNEPPSVL